MQIRRFEAKNMTAALRHIKEELGAEAVILSARSLRRGHGLFGSLKYAGVEVTAAVDTKLPAPLKGVSPSGGTAYTRYEKSGHGFVPSTHPKADSAKNEAGRSNFVRRQLRQRKKTDAGSENRKLSALYQQLRAQDIERSIVSELVEELKLIPAASEALAAGNVKSHLISLLEEMGVATDSIRRGDTRRGIHALIGTCGVGKTTTIAKLAARLAIRENRSVGLITMDNYGITALEHLAAYARIIGIPLETAVNRTELKLALKKLKDRQIILIDTPGISPGDSDRIQDLKSCFTKLHDLKTHLVISATTRKRDILTITGSLRQLPIHCLLFTKLDETSSVGNIVNTLIRTGLPLSYLSQGRQVPDDLRRGSRDLLVDLVLAPGCRQTSSSQQLPNPTGAAMPATDNGKVASERIVANRNSDVYHLAGCKWARKIKPGNIIEFADPREAEGRHFLPCRSCNPDRLGSGDGTGDWRETVKAKSYSYLNQGLAQK